jgi:hypothetical protein
VLHNISTVHNSEAWLPYGKNVKKESITYITLVDHQVCSVVVVIVGLKKGELWVRHAAIVKTIRQC